MVPLTKFENVKNMSTEEYFNNNEFSVNIFNAKYKTEKYNTYVKRIWKVVSEIASVEETVELQKYWRDRWFSEIFNDYWKPAGSIMQGAGSGKKISLSNCNTISLGTGDNKNEWDSLEGIIRNTAYTVAKSAAYRQGLGIDFSRIRPKNMKVGNSANKSTGVIHWISFIDSIGNYVGQCLIKNTPVLTTCGYKLVQDVTIKDVVFSMNGKSKVLKTFDNGKKPIWKVTTEYGDVLEASEDHKIKIAVNGEIITKKIKDVSAGDFVVASFIKDYVGKVKRLPKFTYTHNSYNNSNRLVVTKKLPTELNTDLAYLIGIIFGDGYMAKTVELALADAYLNITSKVDGILFSLFGVHIGDPGFNIRNGDGAVKRVTLNKYVTDFLKFIGATKQKAGNLKFPDILKDVKLPILIAFFDGLFDADGYNSKTRKNISLELIDYDLLKSIKDAFFKHGIITKLKKHKEANGNSRSSYRLSFVGTSSIETVMKYTISEKLLSAPLAAKYDRLKTPFRAKYLHIKIGSLKKKDINGDSFLSCAKYKKYAKKESDLYIQKISSIENTGNMENTYDIGIEDSSHFFNVPGMLVSNSGRKPAMLISLSINHPDIEEFIQVKKDYTRIQNANISVQVTNSFYEAVKADLDWELTFTVPAVQKGQKVYVDKYTAVDQNLHDDIGFYYIAIKDSNKEVITKKVKAKKLFTLIAKNMWKNAEPGIQNIDIAREYSNSDAIYDPSNTYSSKVISSNACLTSGHLNQ